MTSKKCRSEEKGADEGFLRSSGNNTSQPKMPKAKLPFTNIKIDKDVLVILAIILIVLGGMITLANAYDFKSIPSVQFIVGIIALLYGLISLVKGL